MIEKSTHLYEVLLRFDPQGLAGAHAIFIDVIREDDSILSSVLKQAQPLSAAGVPELIGSTLPQLADQIMALTEDLRLERARVAQLEPLVEELRIEREMVAQLKVQLESNSP